MASSNPPIPEMDPLAQAASEVGDVASAIRTLAWINGVTGAPEPVDVFATAASQLADTAIEFDSVERLLLGLARDGIITDQQRFAMHAIYLRQRG